MSDRDNPPTPAVSFATLNPNGLNDASKRRALFHMLRNRVDGVGVSFITETHAAGQEVVEGWLRDGAGPGLPWEGASAWACGGPASCGVAILVHSRVGVESFQPVATCPHGRFVGAFAEVDRQPLLLFSVYAPCVPERRVSFFAEELTPAIRDALRKFPTAQLVIGGDFNCIESAVHDQSGGCGSRLVGFEGGLRPLQAEFALVDTYRAKKPGGREFTHRATGGGSSARLDRVLVGEEVMAGVVRVGMGDGWPGDHRLAFASARLPRSLPRGPGDWVFPRNLLCDPDFTAEFAAHIEDWFARHPLSASLSAGHRWEAFKRHARDRARLWDLKAAQQRKKERARLERAAAVAAQLWARRPECPRAAAGWAAEQQRLQASREAAAERVARFAGVAWEEYGEQGTAWFHRLAQARKADSSIPELEVLDGGGGDAGASARTVSLGCPAGREAAAEHIARFYDGHHSSGLFRPQPTSTPAQDEILSSIDRVLSDDDRGACEAGICEQDLAAALGECDPGKSPGTDGLTYEFYKAFWGVLGARLAEVFTEAFGEGGEGRLPESMRMGLVVLIHKGDKVGPRSNIANYRPITLLNCDCKLLAKALAQRFAAPLSTVIDDTQTAFLPDRWIGDNVLFHLEEIDYLETSLTPGVIVFMDFEKAYDRVSRPFILKCMGALGFGPTACGWVGLLLRDTRAACRFNGFHTRTFDVLSGVAQGSPLSPALYLIAAQPLAARLRQLQRRGTLGGIRLPDSSLAPPSAQHADDTTLHLPSPDDLSIAWRLAVEPFCEASGSRAHPDKTKAMLLGGAGGRGPRAERAVSHEDTGVKILPPGAALKHLGVMLGPGDVGEGERARKFENIRGGAVSTMKHWAARGLSFHGRAHVAQQCVASTLVFHASFSRPPPQCLAAIQAELNTFVRGGDALCLPCGEVVSLPKRLGGMGVPNLQQVVHALQAGIIQRLLHPARRPWKVLMLHSLNQIAPAAAGARAVFSTLVSPPSTPRAGGHGPALPGRLGGYLESFRTCRPHRLVRAEDLPAPAVLSEPLFGNPSVLDGGGPLSPHAFPLASAAGVLSVATLADALRQQPPPQEGLLAELTSLEACLPPAWAALAHLPNEALQVAFEWWEWPAAGRAACSDHGLQRVAAGPQEVVHALRGATEATAYVVGPDGALVAGRAVPWPPPPSRPAGRPCLVARVPRRGGSSTTAQGRGTGRVGAMGQGSSSTAPDDEGRPYYVGPWAHGAAAPLDPTQWGLAGSPLLRSTTASRTQFLLQDAAAGCGKSTAAGCGLGRAARPAVWDGSLEQRERGWLGALAPPSSGRRAPPEDTQGADPFLPASARWMVPGGPRLLPTQRAQQRMDSGERQQERVDGRTAQRRRHDRWQLYFGDPRAGRPDDDPPPWAGVWRRLHRAPGPRAHRFTAWRAMHGALPVAAHPAVWDRRVRPLTTCHRRCCTGCAETVTHALLSCPVVWCVWQWAGQLWRAVTGLPPPPLTARALLGGDTQSLLPSPLPPSPPSLPSPPPLRSPFGIPSAFV